MCTNYERKEHELAVKLQILRKMRTAISKFIAKLVAEAEESARNNQPYNHRVLYTIKDELNKLFEEELKKLQ